jgi:hypothetical protein
LFVWACRGISAGKGLNQCFFSTHPRGEDSKSTARAAYIRNLKASQRRNSSIGTTISLDCPRKDKASRQDYTASI